MASANGSHRGLCSSDCQGKNQNAKQQRGIYQKPCYLQAAIMCAGDLTAAHGARMLPLLDTGGMTQPGKSLLAQLLLKAGSNDKKFVIEEAQHALDTIASSMDAPAILARLLPYAAHKNPKVCKSNSILQAQHDSAV